MKMSDFLRAFVEDNPGLIRNRKGEVLGEHKGLNLSFYNRSASPYWCSVEQPAPEARATAWYGRALSSLGPLIAGGWFQGVC